MEEGRKKGAAAGGEARFLHSLSLPFSFLQGAHQKEKESGKAGGKRRRGGGGLGRDLVVEEKKDSWDPRRERTMREEEEGRRFLCRQ